VRARTKIQATKEREAHAAKVAEASAARHKRDAEREAHLADGKPIATSGQSNIGKIARVDASGLVLSVGTREPEDVAVAERSEQHCVASRLT
jgi:hypothetical protein